MRSRHAVFAALIVVTLVAASAPAVAGRHPQPRSAQFGFATPVMVDPFRPGFEPDVAIDARRGRQAHTYVSMPFGFTSTQSFVYRSDDGRASFHLVEGNIAGKAATCAGGGDTDLRVDPVNGSLYLIDLQGLTNFSGSASRDGGRTWQTTCTAVNGSGVDRQWLGLDSNGGRAAVGPGANDGRLYLAYDNVAQQNGANQLVMNESLDGVYYGAKCATGGVPCPAPPAVISRDQGTPGNVVVDDVRGSPYQHSVYAIHTGAVGNSVLVSYCRGESGDKTAAAVADHCTDPTNVNPTDVDRMNRLWRESAPRPACKCTTGVLFPALAADTAGNLYAVWAQYPTNDQGNPAGPGAVWLAVSRNGAKSWSQPVRVSPRTLGNTVMPWVAAGDPGRVVVAYYGARAAKEGDSYGPDTLDHGVWNTHATLTTNALGRHPRFQTTTVSDHPVKFGNVSTAGLGGSPDRSLGDFMQVQIGENGRAVVVYVDDTSANRSPDLSAPRGQTPPSAAGPIMIATQDSGPSLYRSAGVLRPARHPMGSIHDRSKDGYYTAAGMKTAGPSSLDIVDASIEQPDRGHLRIRMKLADSQLASHLAVPAGLGGPVGEWIVRWAAPSYRRAGDGNAFYVGMESINGADPKFFVGTTGSINTTKAKYFTYPRTTEVPGSVRGGTITWTVPLSAVGSPRRGQGLFSITGFTATQLTGSEPGVDAPNGGQIGNANIPNLIDATPPFTFRVRL